jgi:CubicO group peptidase (beta-lactamase class C family)
VNYRNSTFGLWIISLGVFGAVCPTANSASSPSWVAPPPSFTNPDRREQLAAAFPEIDERVRAFLAREKVPGAAWGIVIDGKLVHVGVEGLRDVASQAPVQKDTVFRIASMTKSFTAMAILQLRDAGKLSLDDPVEKHLPELRSLDYPTTDAPRITLRHLLTMSAGFPEDNPWGDQQFPRLASMNYCERASLFLILPAWLSSIRTTDTRSSGASFRKYRASVIASMSVRKFSSRSACDRRR